ncbi:UNKNOWN [Stylonychia lemnae]|uniref:Uncharacterized protein n=1 Tax=Stylonychia lemnae TaxID=5949 RepID=A0A078ANX5_STYLE|nr:UNKNOWN [Stylonychia lemnae]|eukprot:CDW84070.1 UNKNOWN [Stylonychia lemnae]
MEEVSKKMEEVHDDVEVDGVLYTATQTAAKYAFDAFDHGIQAIGKIFTEARDLIDVIQLVIDKTGEDYFQKSLITELKEPLINLGHWIATMKGYTENIQQNYFAQSILVLSKIKKSFTKNKDLYTEVYNDWSQSELARTDDFQSDWAEIEKAIGVIADQFLSAYNAQKIKDLMASVTRMFNLKCDQVNKDLKDKQAELKRAEEHLEERENTRNWLNFLWLGCWVAAAIAQAVMASEVAAAHTAVNNAYAALKEAIAAGNEL